MPRLLDGGSLEVMEGTGSQYPRGCTPPHIVRNLDRANRFRSRPRMFLQDHSISSLDRSRKMAKSQMIRYVTLPHPVHFGFDPVICALC